MSKTKVTLGMLILVAVFSATLNVYFLRRQAGVEPLSNGKEAYFFVGTGTSGFHEKWIFYPLTFALEWLGLPTQPLDKRGSILVIHVTPSSVERHEAELKDLGPGGGPKFWTPLEGRIWANYPGIGGLCWWATDHFEPATEEEKQRIGRLPSKKQDEGWTAEQDGITVGDLSLQIRGLGSDSGEPLLIEMRKQGQEPTIVYTFTPSVGRVSGDEYRRAFPTSE
jgi:hypothetical protein